MPTEMPPPPPQKRQPPNPTGGIGRWMLIGAWVFGLALLTLIFSQYFSPAQRNPNQQVAGNFNESGVSVTLRMNYQGHYLASGKINTQPADFLVDTGATWVAVPGSVATRLGLRAGMAIETQTANGSTTAYLSKLDSVELGAIRLDNVKATIVPAMEGEEVLLGMSFLRQLELVQQNDTLMLSQRFR